MRLRGKGELRRQRRLAPDSATGQTDAAPADLDHTDLDYADLDHADLDHADLDHADLDRIDLDRTAPDGLPVPEPRPEDAAGGPVSRGSTIGIRRLVVITVVAAVAFGLATVSFADPSDRDCSVTMRGDRRYGLELEGPYPGDHDHPSYRLVVTKRGEPLDPEKFCISSFPGGVLVVVDDVRRSHIHMERERFVEEDADRAS